ncbi:MAG: NAD(P)/FAD-dependent oxidoreductase [Roseobacter sp.]
MKVIVVGAGIIGALTAFRLVQHGADVTIIDAGQPATAASGASFGWINANFFGNEDYFHLRHASMRAHRALAHELGSQSVQWQGCLCWEETGDAFDAQYNALKDLGYGVRVVEKAEFQALEPAVAAPDRALLFEEEGAVDLVHLTQDALQAGVSLGLQIITGVAVTRIEVQGDLVRGVRWSGGVIACDQVVLATGVATERLLADVGATLPMLTRPGLMVRSQRMAPVLAHILASPEQELRQDAQGRLLAPAAASHQADTSETITQSPADLADAAMARVSTLLGQPLRWEEVALAHRPVPQDGMPAIGHCGPAGLYIATMHSGATLAPLAGELAAMEVMEQPLTNTQAALIAPYRPQRFTG